MTIQRDLGVASQTLSTRLEEQKKPSRRVLHIGKF